MGRLEKIVVLTVLFLVAVILGVSLNQGGDPGGPAPAEVLAAGPQEPEPGPASPRGAQPGEAPPGALSSTLAEDPPPAAVPEPEPEPPLAPAPDLPEPGLAEPTDPSEEVPPAPAQPPPASRPQTGGLLTTEGLREGLRAEEMIYTWAAGDTFAALARRYYGSESEVSRLRKANEGRKEVDLQAGDRIFVPAGPGEPTERLTPSEQAAGRLSDGVYHVEAGDMLGKIAQRFYGSASKWRLIYEANRDVLASPDDLHVGMALRIPKID
jgi:5'-nucleotidase